MFNKSSANKSIEVMFFRALRRMSELNSKDRLALYAEYREWIERIDIDKTENENLFLFYLRDDSIDVDLN